MKLARAAFHAYQLPLARPLLLAGHPVAARDGALVHLVSAGGLEGWGDVAPLPGFSPESMIQAHAQLRRLAALAPGWTPHPEAPWRLPPGDWMPSVRFGWEAALLALAAAERKISPAACLGAGPASAVRVNALLAGLLEGCVEEARAAVRAGYVAVKMKVGRAALQEEVACVRQVAAALPPGVELRLDANRAWTLAQAVEVARGLEGVRLGYVEEPLREPAGLSELHRATGWPLALDESLHDLDPADSVLPYAGVVAWVLKPTRLGGVARVLAWIARARRDGVRPVLSAMFESGVGSRAIAELALLAPETAVGLDTYRSLAADVLHPRLDLCGGRLDLAQARLATVRPESLLSPS